MRIVELPPESTLSTGKRPPRIYETKGTDVYEGPSKNFPYTTLRALGVTQLILGSALGVLGLVQASITEADRAISIASGTTVIWCPLFAVAAGIVGMLFTKKRYWDTECMRVGFIVTSAMSSLFLLAMLALRIGFIVTSAMSSLFLLAMLALVGFIQFYYYDIHDVEPEETYLGISRRGATGKSKEDYQAMVGIIFAVGVILFLVSLVSAFVGCGYSQTYRPGRTLERRRQYVKPISQMTLLEDPPMVPPPQMQQAPRSRITMVPQPPMQFIQQPAFFPEPPPLQFVPTTGVINSPPPSLLYMV